MSEKKNLKSKLRIK